MEGGNDSFNKCFLSNGFTSALELQPWKRQCIHRLKDTNINDTSAANDQSHCRDVCLWSQCVAGWATGLPLIGSFWRGRRHHVLALTESKSFLCPQAMSALVQDSVLSLWPPEKPVTIQGICFQCLAISQLKSTQDKISMQTFFSRHQLYFLIWSSNT